MSEWQPIETAPRDGTRVLVFAQLDPPEKWVAEIHDLPTITCVAAYHPDAGWCVDEVREVTHWMPLPPPPSALENGPAGLADATQTPPSQG